MKRRCLIAYESSGVVRDAFARAGWEAWSCDLLPTERPGNHLQCDALKAMAGQSWDFTGAHPPCTYLCSSGLWRNNRDLERLAKSESALREVRAVMERIAACGMGYLENPVGRIGSEIRPADQYVQPYAFGHDASKKTGLWLVGLPLLKSTKRIEGRLVVTTGGKTVERWGNQTDSGQNRLGPGPDRWRERSRTYEGIADAMATQWTAFLERKGNRS